jgi:hypothetical protein
MIKRKRSYNAARAAVLQRYISHEIYDKWGELSRRGF